MKLLTAIVSLAALAGTAAASNMEGCGLVVLDYSASGALNLVGSSSIQVPTKAVYVNSNSATALQSTGTAVLDAEEVHVVGHAVFNGSSYCTGTVTQSAVPFANPLSNIYMPNEASASATFGGCSINGGSVTMLPGRYTGLVTIGGGANVTMSPGIYHFSAGFRINSGNISGVGVALVIHGGNLNIAGSSSLLLVPPTDGVLMGVVVCQPPANTNEMYMVGNSYTDIWGTVYIPSARLNLTGNATAAGQPAMMGDLVVAKRVTISGIGQLKLGHANLIAITLPKLPLAD